MREVRVGQRDLEDFARKLLPYLRSRRVDTSWFTRSTVSDLWELLGSDLPRYAHAKRWHCIEMFTAETAVPWDETYQTDKAYLRIEGYVFSRGSLAQLPTDPEAWDNRFFGDVGTWFLLRMWVYYLKHARWLE